MQRIIALLNAMDSLLDSVEAQLFWMLKFAEENNLPRDRLKALRGLMSRSMGALEEMAILQDSLARSRISGAILQGRRSADDTPPDKLPVYPRGGCRLPSGIYRSMLHRQSTD
jgi:hypothetical protein